MDYQQYLDEKLPQLRIVCQSQWDYLKFSDFDTWMNNNFGDDVEGKYYAVKIMLHTIYYSKRNIEDLLRFGLFDKIYGELIKSEQIKNQLLLPHNEALAKLEELKSKTYFIPLLDTDKPSESGNRIIGDLVHKLQISEKQVDFHWEVTEEKLSGYKTLIFVDDCIGSGMQLKKFWNSEKVANIKSYCKKNDVSVYYLVLIGYDKNLNALKHSSELNDIQVVVCDILTDKNRVFSDENIVWEKDFDERAAAIKYFEKIKKEKGINFLGFKKLDFAIILNDRLPNWSLPIFWRENANWKLLLQRKTSI